jgi:hypothetical protein
LKEEYEDNNLWRTQFGRGYGPVAWTWDSMDWIQLGHVVTSGPLMWRW